MTVFEMLRKGLLSHIGIAVLIAGMAQPTSAQDTAAQEPTAEGLHEQALDLVRRGQNDDARVVLGDGEALVTTYAPAALLLGSLRRGAGELASAEAVFRAALDRSDGSMDVVLWSELAVTRSWQGDLAGAEDAYRRALTIDATYTAASVGLARILRWRGQMSEAGVIYRRLLDGAEAQVEAYAGLGFVALAALDADAAREWFGRALDIAPDNAEALDGMSRLSEADRWQVSWVLSRSEGVAGAGSVEGRISAAYRVSPISTLSGEVSWVPRPTEIVGSDPNADELRVLSWSAMLGWKQTLAARWDAAVNVRQVRSEYGSGYLATLESGRWLGSKWVVSGGARGGKLPRIGSEGVAWAGVTRVGAERRALSLTGFYGTDFREAASKSFLAAASTGVGSRTTLRGTYARGWTSTAGFWQATLEARVEVRPGRSVTVEAYRFDGAYTMSGIRLGARLGF